MKIKLSEITSIKLSVNPPQALVQSEYAIIHKGKIKRWVGIGWVIERDATPADYNTIPEVINE